MEDYGERSTGTRDEHYNLVSVLYHALNGADSCDHYHPVTCGRIVPKAARGPYLSPKEKKS